MTDFFNDIPLSLAYSAHAGSSFIPDQRATQVRDGYAATLQGLYDELSKHATTDDQRLTLGVEFARFRDGYRKRYLAYLASQSRTYSVMISGPSNFPTRRMEKRNRVVDKRRDELVEFLPRAKAAMLKTLHPELRPIMAGDSDATQRLQAKIAEAEECQNRMRAANAAIRKHKKAGADAQTAALVALGFRESIARELLTPDFCQRLGFADYQLTNNNANIRRMRERLEGIARNQAAEETVTAGENARVEDCPADNRVRLFFPGKPAEAIRSTLKSSGFRWSPTIGAWQAYRNTWTINTANRIAGVPVCAPKDICQREGCTKCTGVVLCDQCDTPFCPDHGTPGGDMQVQDVGAVARPSICWKCGGFDVDG